MKPLAILTLLLLPAVAAQNDSAARRRNAPQTFTGCLDQREEHYFLTEESELRPVARLTASGASEDSWFAKHVGHQVRITGTAEGSGDARVIAVKKIESVADTCSSPPASQ